MIQDTGKKKRVDYLSDYRFEVITKNQEKVGFMKVSGLTTEIELEEIPEGGKNDGPHLVIVPHKRHQPLVLERGIFPKKSWIEKIKPGMMLGTWMEIFPLNSQKKRTARSFRISDGMVTKCEISGLDAMGNSILVNKIEIVHNGIILN